uniref:Mitochondrial import inner membrane translocase subunit n=1 Tax=Pogona vitticeps TaxID=103695 RepID=A0ABM5FVH9_9SAUR
MEGRADPHQEQLRSLRDFLLVYNRMTELCFQRCVSNLNYRALAREEESCLDGCAGKLVRSNHRLMAAYVQLMPSIVQRRVADYEAAATAAAAAGGGGGGGGQPGPEEPPPLAPASAALPDSGALSASSPGR